MSFGNLTSGTAALRIAGGRPDPEEPGTDQAPYYLTDFVLRSGTVIALFLAIATVLFGSL
ncbi:MAG: hypothetical protein QM809_05160 [Gordonia sp. (in: high G+C Gram-positive bacteria)]|uniref:hypothetical protein n=1 Tax=Gordonia sp. (in: high G+C Gram-positive bacteria) TaxID=84139 RepID=UPI0039E2FBBD